MVDTNHYSAKNLLQISANRLRKAEVPESEASAAVLLSELLDIRRGDIPFYREPLTSQQQDSYADMISRREKREPVQRILGYAYFRNLKLKLSEATLIPRFDTESVVDLALKVIDEKGSVRVLDIGTGTGAIAISIAQERPDCEVHASDISPEAVEVARSNAAANDAAVEFHVSDLASGLKRLEGSVELLVSNPPYIESGDMDRLQIEVRDHDPGLALDGGEDGLDLYRRMLDESRPLLTQNAGVVLEVGDGQADSVRALGQDLGFESKGACRDLTGSVRAIALCWMGAGH